MIDRYTRPEMGIIWKEETKYQKWLDVEIAACEAHAHFGNIPKNVPLIVKKKARFSVSRINKIESKVKHDVIAFLTNIAEHIGPMSRYVHYGLTSSDVLDTAFALQLKDASEIILKGLDGLIGELKKKAKKHKKDLMIGRSHGVHAEPVTFGLKMALFYEEFRRNRVRVTNAVNGILFLTNS